MKKDFQHSRLHKYGRGIILIFKKHVPALGRSVKFWQIVKILFSLILASTLLLEIDRIVISRLSFRRKRSILRSFLLKKNGFFAKNTVECLTCPEILPYQYLHWQKKDNWVEVFPNSNFEWILNTLHVILQGFRTRHCGISKAFKRFLLRRASTKYKTFFVSAGHSHVYFLVDYTYAGVLKRQIIYYILYLPFSFANF